jgi:hypothetical protein
VEITLSSLKGKLELFVPFQVQIHTLHRELRCLRPGGHKGKLTEVTEQEECFNEVKTEQSSPALQLWHQEYCRRNMEGEQQDITNPD